MMYIIKFKTNEISENPETWAQFGDFFGGILNPIIGILNLLVLCYLTLKLSDRDNDNYKNQLEISNLPVGDINVHYDKNFSISVNNYGVGPMVIKKMVYSCNNIEYCTLSHLFVKLPDETLRKLIHFSFKERTIFPSGMEKEIFKINFSEMIDLETSVVESMLKDLSLKRYKLYVDYEDIFGNKQKRLAFDFYENFN